MAQLQLQVFTSKIFQKLDHLQKLFLLLLAILCAAAPDQAPFMADESVLAVPELGKLEYNLKHYLAYAKKIEKKVHQLNKLGKKLLMSFYGYSALHSPSSCSLSELFSYKDI